MHPEDLIEKHFTRLKPEQKRALHKLGIRTVRDLLYHFPARYESSGDVGTIAGISAGAEVTLYGTVRKPDIRKTWKSRRPVAEAWLHDASGKIKMMWFSQPYIAKTLHDGMVVKVSGKVAGAGAKIYLANPAIDKSPIAPDAAVDSLFSRTNQGDTLQQGVTLISSRGDSSAPASVLYPIYPESQGVSSLWLMHAVKKVFETHTHENIEDPIPQEILARYKLPLFLLHSSSSMRRRRCLTRRRRANASPLKKCSHSKLLCSSAAA